MSKPREIRIKVTGSGEQKFDLDFNPCDAEVEFTDTPTYAGCGILFDTLRGDVQGQSVVVKWNVAEIREIKCTVKGS